MFSDYTVEKCMTSLRSLNEPRSFSQFSQHCQRHAKGVRYDSGYVAVVEANTQPSKTAAKSKPALQWRKGSR